MIAPNFFINFYFVNWIMQNIKETFNNFLNTQLNPEQQKVVSKTNGILLVCAGAGSGKTRIITARMANLIMLHDIPSASILALTFTNKAAKEMKERIRKFVGDSYILPYVGTFHSYCLKILKTNSHLLKFENFSILDSDDQEKLIKGLINKNNLQKKITPKQLISTISKIKNDYPSSNLAMYDNIVRDLYASYEKEKELAHCFDFDDLLIETLALFKNKAFKQKFQKEVRHILVDEYQDTNLVQHELLMQMTKNGKKFQSDSLCVVGDEDQSIYSWRGATVTNIINFKDDFPESISVAIEQNYRSVQPILKVANNIISNNRVRNKKNLWSDKDASDRIRILSCNSVYQEGEAIAIFLKLMRNRKKLSDCAILYRSHYQSRPLEEALLKHSIPYVIVGGIQFYERLEIKDLLAYLKLAANPFDRIAFLRIINTPTRGLADKFQEQFLQVWQDLPFSTYKEVARHIIDQQTLTKSKEMSLKNFISILDSISIKDKPSVALEKIINSISYFTYLKSSFDEEESKAKIENVKELTNGVKYSEDNNESLTISDFLDEVALLQETIKNSQTNNECVKLMTLHGAKGLEFDTVILAGLEEGILPSSHSQYDDQKLEEERRLMYVGVTRAQERLLISYSKLRYTYGQPTQQLPSRFLDEIPETFAKWQDCNYWQSPYFLTYFSEWLNSQINDKKEIKSTSGKNIISY